MLCSEFTVDELYSVHRDLLVSADLQYRYTSCNFEKLCKIVLFVMYIVFTFYDMIKVKVKS